MARLNAKISLTKADTLRHWPRGRPILLRGERRRIVRRGEKITDLYTALFRRHRSRCFIVCDLGKEEARTRRGWNETLSIRRRPSRLRSGRRSRILRHRNTHYNNNRTVIMISMGRSFHQTHTDDHPRMSNSNFNES
jgi:hypothetical protein